MLEPLPLGKIPPEEHAKFCSAVCEAVRAGRQDDAPAGYAVLDLGLAWAESADGDQPWREDLVLCYRTALHLYCLRFIAAVDEAGVAHYYGSGLGG